MGQAYKLQRVLRIASVTVWHLVVGASAKLCGVEQRAPSVFGRATIRLGIGPHSSSLLILPVKLELNVGEDALFGNFSTHHCFGSAGTHMNSLRRSTASTVALNTAGRAVPGSASNSVTSLLTRSTDTDDR